MIELSLPRSGDRLATAVRRERLPTNLTARAHATHRWFNFIAGFSPEFVNLCIDGLAAQREGILLDPFCGCATAPVVARHRGMRAVGYEPHPIFARIARAKLFGADLAGELKEIEAAIGDGFRQMADPALLSDSARAFLSKLFPAAVLGQLLGARAALVSRGLSGNELAFLILSRILERSSHSQTDGIYKAPTSSKKAQSPLQACGQIIGMIRADLMGLERSVAGTDVRLFEKSSETMEDVADNQVGIVVTSPPYLNNFDYAEMTRMYLYFWGIAGSWRAISERVRSRLIVNTTTALQGHKARQVSCREGIPHTLHDELGEIRSTLAALKAGRAGKKDYDLLVYPYFCQLTNVLRECHRCLAPEGPIHIMIADAAFYGVHVSTPQYLARILEDLKFRDVRCDLVRSRGERWILSKRQGSKVGLGEYHVHARK